MHYYSSGYIDDETNTDNAWVEAEIWNFHYGGNSSFPNLRTDVCLLFLKKIILMLIYLGYGYMERHDI
jgi:hypothetical protein